MQPAPVRPIISPKSRGVQIDSNCSLTCVKRFEGRHRRGWLMAGLLPKHKAAYVPHGPVPTPTSILTALRLSLERRRAGKPLCQTCLSDWCPPLAICNSRRLAWSAGFSLTLGNLRAAHLAQYLFDGWPMKSGRIPAPRLPQASQINRGSISDSRTSSGKRSALSATL
jgi:hypothetical protein